MLPHLKCRSLLKTEASSLTTRTQISISQLTHLLMVGSSRPFLPWPLIKSSNLFNKANPNRNNSLSKTCNLTLSVNKCLNRCRWCHLSNNNSRWFSRVPNPIKCSNSSLTNNSCNNSSPSRCSSNSLTSSSSSSHSSYIRCNSSHYSSSKCNRCKWCSSNLNRSHLLIRLPSMASFPCLQWACKCLRWVSTSQWDNSKW